MEENSLLETIDKNPEKSNFSCHFCNYFSDKKTNLRRHEQTMHQLAHHQLICCGQRFLSKASYRDHTKELHKYGHKCVICYRVFNRKALLKRHQSVHTGKREFGCLLCSYASSHKSNLDRHMKTHSGQDMGEEKKEIALADSTSSHHHFEEKFPILSALLSSEEEHKRRISHSIESILARPVRRDGRDGRVSDSPEEWMLRKSSPLSLLGSASFRPFTHQLPPVFPFQTAPYTSPDPFLVELNLN